MATMRSPLRGSNGTAGGERLRESIDELWPKAMDNKKHSPGLAEVHRLDLDVDDAEDSENQASDARV